MCELTDDLFLDVGSPKSKKKPVSPFSFVVAATTTAVVAVVAVVVVV